MRDPKHPRQFTGESRRRIVEPRLARPASAASALPQRDAGAFHADGGGGSGHAIPPACVSEITIQVSAPTTCRRGPTGR